MVGAPSLSVEGMSRQVKAFPGCQCEYPEEEVRVRQ